MPSHHPRIRIPLLVLMLSLAWGAGCASAKTTIAASPDRSTLTGEQLAELRVDNAYDAILALRSNWLQERGPDSINNPSKVIVVLDNVELGLVETLRTIPIRTITRIRHLDGVEANARYGVGHGAGAIVITTYPTP